MDTKGLENICSLDSVLLPALESEDHGKAYHIGIYYTPHNYQSQ